MTRRTSLHGLRHFSCSYVSYLDNAAKYTKNDSQFDIYITRDGDYINIAFEMDSILIEDDELDHIFQEGYSGKSAHLLFKSGQRYWYGKG